MILGSYMELPSGFGRGGIRILDCSLRARALPLASALVSASSEGMAGAGTTGDTTGITTTFVSTTTTTSPAAEFSLTATTSIMPADFMAEDFTAGLVADEVSARRSKDSRHHTPNLVPIPAHSVVLIMEESRGDSPLAGSRALAEASMEEVVSTGAAEAEAVTGNSVQPNTTDDMEKHAMRTNDMNLEALETVAVKLACGFASTVLVRLRLGLLLLVGFANSSFAQAPQPNAFSSPAEASNALFQAAQSEDEQTLEAVLGAGKEITSSNDEVEDKLEREQFARKYQEMHRLVREPDGSTVLYIGAENWPFPIPLVSKNGAWYFDSEAGTKEIKFRRIGENEATAIQVCEEFAMAKNAADAKAASEDPITRFAESLASAGATNVDNKEPNLFHGYYFRIVARNASSDVNGPGKRGLTLIAYPAEYQSSGVKTFVVTRRGVVFEKDLGPETTTVAPQMTARTGSSWNPAT
jgi:hypothetical protein